MKHILIVEIALWFVLGAALLQNLRPLHNSRRAIIALVMFLFLMVGLRDVEHIIALRWHEPSIWDVRSFWVWGRVAMTTHRIYDPAASLALGRAFPYDYGWTSQFLNVGFIYPPATILLFAPLGLFTSPQAASPFWYTFNIIALIAAIVVLWRLFFQEYGVLGLLAVAVLTVTLKSTFSTFSFGQPLPVMLLLLSCYLADRFATRRGVWLGLAFIVKPMAIAFLLLPVLRRTWSEVTAATVTILAGTLVTIELFGWSNIWPYFANGPSRRYPLVTWMEQSNESLFSAVLRLTHQAVPDSLVHARLFLLSAIVVTAITVYFCVRSAPRDPAVTLSFLIGYSLLVFPPSAGYYNDILLIPMLLLWNRFGSRRPWHVVAYFSFIYAILEWLSPIGFLAPFSIWLAFAWIIARAYQKEPLEGHRMLQISSGN